MNQMAYFRRKVYEPCWNDTNRNTQANQKPDQIRTVTLWLSTCKYTQRDVQACHLANHIRNCKNEVDIMQNMKVQTINTVYLLIGNQGDEQYLAPIVGQTNIHGFSYFSRLDTFTDSKEQSQTNNRPKQGNRKQRVHKPVGSSASI